MLTPWSVCVFLGAAGAAAGASAAWEQARDVPVADGLQPGESNKPTAAVNMVRMEKL